MSIKSFFEMSRHERRGTVVVLTLIALLLLAMHVYNCRRPSSAVMQPVVEQEQFDAMTDTVHAPEVKPTGTERHHEKSSKRRSARKRSPNGPSPSQPPPMDPVPQF